MRHKTNARLCLIKVAKERREKGLMLYNANVKLTNSVFEIKVELNLETSTHAQKTTLLVDGLT